MQLLKILDDWTLQLDSGKQIDVIYTDFVKAFDKVPHHALISKLRAYGLDDTLIQWQRQTSAFLLLLLWDLWRSISGFSCFFCGRNLG